LAALDYVVIAGYFTLLPLIGWYCSRRSQGTSDFFLGGRRIPWWAAGISIYSTMLSGITYMGIPALSYAGNWSRMVAGFAILLVAPIVVRFYVPFFCRLQVTSAYEYLELRFNLAARLLTTTLFLLFQLGRVAIVVSLPALALSAVTGMSLPACILLTGVIATLYTYLGGIEAVIWVDVLQVAVLIGGAVLTLLSVVAHLDDGWASLVHTGSADGKFRMVSLDLDHTQAVMWVILIGGFFESLYSYSSDQTIIQRYLTTKDETSAARSIWTNAALSMPCLLLFFLLGSALYAFYKAHPDQTSPLLPTDAVFPLFVSSHLPAGLVGLVIAGIFAASMDNLPSSVTCMATAIVTDFFLRFRPDSTDRTRLRLARCLTVVLGALGTCTALVMTRYDIKSQVDQFQTIIGLFAGGVAGIFALGIFTTRAHGVGGLAGLLGSALVQYLVATFTTIHFLLYSATGALSCFGIGYAVSVLIPQRPRPIDGLTIHTLKRETALSRLPRSENS
jgi:SSS family transporter